MAWTQATDHRERGALLEAAEQAMRRAKAKGKGRVEVAPLPIDPPIADLNAIPEHIDDSPTAPRPIGAPKL